MYYKSVSLNNNDNICYQGLGRNDILYDYIENDDTSGNCEDWKNWVYDAECSKCYVQRRCSNKSKNIENLEYCQKCGCDHPMKETMVKDNCHSFNDVCSSKYNPCYPGKCSVTESKDGYKCQCPDGYKYNHGRCEDINECDVDGICGSGLCINTIGTYKCQCYTGSVLDENKKCTDICSTLKCQNCEIVNNKPICVCESRCSDEKTQIKREECDDSGLDVEKIIYECSNGSEKCIVIENGERCEDVNLFDDIMLTPEQF